MLRTIINISYSIFKGVLLGGSVYLFSKFLDVTVSSNTHDKLLKENSLLLKQANNYNFYNLVIISPLIYSVIDQTILSHEYKFSFFKYTGIILTQNILYFFSHREMHRNITYYAKIHRFHHEFEKLLIPSSGNAVTHSEFVISYAIPFFFGAYITHPTELTFVVSIGTISILNMLIHTNELKDVPWCPYLVSPSDHIKHHSEKTKNYAAPLVNIDKMEEDFKDWDIISI